MQHRGKDVPKAVFESGPVADDLSRTVSHGRAETLVAGVLLARFWSLLLSWKELSAERWTVPLDDFTERCWWGTQVPPSPFCVATKPMAGKIGFEMPTLRCCGSGALRVEFSRGL